MKFGPFVAAAGALACALGIGRVQASLSEDHRRLGRAPEVYALPSSEHLVVISLGHRSAFADLLYGRTLVAAGIHFTEKRVFEQLDSYLQAIVDLDPNLREVYHYADSLLTLSTVDPPPANYRLARNLMERGTRRFPDDANLALSAGQFMVYVAPPWLPPGEDPQEWRASGYQLIAHACAIWPPGTRLPVGCLGATQELSEAGRVDAAISALRRILSVTDDAETRKSAEERLDYLLGVQRAQEMKRNMEALINLHARDMPLLGRTAYQIVGPETDVQECAGLSFDPSRDAACASSFRAWEEARELSAR